MNVDGLALALILLVIGGSISMIVMFFVSVKRETKSFQNKLKLLGTYGTIKLDSSIEDEIKRVMFEFNE